MGSSHASYHMRTHDAMIPERPSRIPDIEGAEHPLVPHAVQVPPRRPAIPSVATDVSSSVVVGEDQRSHGPPVVDL